jgi:hypothetical protein
VTSYIGYLASSLVEDLKAGGRREIVDAGVDEADERRAAELPSETKRMIANLVDDAAVPLNDLYWQGRLTPAGLRAVVDDVVAMLMDDEDVLTTIVLGVQEADTFLELRKKVEDDLKAIFSAVIANHLSTGAGKLKV